MSDDITFCADTCNNRQCIRHPSNIKNKHRPHSFAYLKDTDACNITIKNSYKKTK